jgi:hypothetical protein
MVNHAGQSMTLEMLYIKRLILGRGNLDLNTTIH